VQSRPASSAVARTSVSIVLPTYNEAGNIVPLAQALLACAALPTDILVVDDDSPDGTWRLVESLQASEPRVRLLRRIGRRGLTSAIQEGIDGTAGDIVVWMDCDFSMPPEVVPQLAQAVADGGCEMAIGSRFAPGGSAKRDLAGSQDSVVGVAMSDLLNVVLRTWLGHGIRDYTSGFIACRREVLERIRLSGDYGEYCIDLLYRAVRLGYRVQELPYVCVPRRSGESKTGAHLGQYLRRGSRYVRTALALPFRWHTGA
jgi:dolichol-phosphate mannosyltransferase